LFKGAQTEPFWLCAMVAISWKPPSRTQSLVNNRRDKPIHQNLEEVAPLQPPRVKSPLRLPRLLQRRGLWKEVLASCVCVSVGVLHPLATEASKSGKVFTCQRDPSEDEPVLCTTDSYLDSDDLIVRRGMPFHPATLTVASQFLAVMISCCMVLAVMGAPAWKRLLDRKSLMRIAPVGLLYGLGDFLQTVACNSASAPVVLVMGQSKLLLTALLSKFMLPSQGAADWPRLIVISCAAAASTDISAGMAANSVMSDFEVQGALLALLKATLSSMGAVLSERDFKKGENYWILSFRVQLMMLCASVAILPWTCSAFFDRGLPPMDVLAEFFQGGPVVKCLPAGVVPRCVPQGAGGSCSCIDHQGWDRWTAVAVFAIVINGYATGIILKYCSAVTKSLCGALSTGVFYVSYVCLGDRPFNLAQATVLVIVAITAYEYAVARYQQRLAAALEALPLATARAPA